MRQRDYLFLIISSAILVIIWITFNIIHTALTSTISVSVGQQLIPIAATFDTVELHDLSARNNVIPAYVISLPPSVSPTIPPVTPIVPLSSTSAQVVTQTIIQQATSGGKTQ